MYNVLFEVWDGRFLLNHFKKEILCKYSLKEERAKIRFTNNWKIWLALWIEFYINQNLPQNEVFDNNIYRCDRTPLVSSRDPQN